MFCPGPKSYQALATIYAVLLLALFGCGSDQDTSAPIATTIAALDGVTVVQPGALADIDLLNLVKANGKVVVQKVYTEQGRCPTPALSVRGFNVYPEAGVACDYRYTVEAGLLQASARITVLATRADNPIIPPLSHPMSLDSGDVTFDLNQLLGAAFPENYILTDTAVMQIQGGVGQQGSVSVTSDTVGNNVITYTPPSLTGVYGITYTLQKDVNPEYTVVGSIYITISQKPNEAPIIQNPSLTYPVSPQPNLLARSDYTIDLALAGMTISVTNGKDYHLAHVQSSTATVSPYDSTANNKRIKFQAATPGEHLVSYIVADDFGGFTLGLIKVKVDAVLNPITWGDFEAGGRTFTAPVLYTPQLANMFNAMPIWDDSVNNNTIPVTTVTGLTPPPSGAATVFGNTLAAFRSYSAAQAYCGTRGGRLPSYDESLLIGGLPDGVDEFGLINTAPGWPKGRPYALMVNGAEPTGFPWERGAYVTCVKHTAMELNLVATEFERFARDSGALLSQELGTLTTEFATQSIDYEIIGGSLMNYPESIVVDPLGTSSRLHRITAKASRNGYATIRFYDTTNPNNYIDTPMLRFSSIDVLDAGGGKLLTGSPSKHDLKELQDSVGNFFIPSVYITESSGFDYPRIPLRGYEQLCNAYSSTHLYGRNNWRLSGRRELTALYSQNGNMSTSYGWPVVVSYALSTTKGSGNVCGAPYPIDLISLNSSATACAAYGFTAYVSCSSDLPVDNDKSTIAVIINNALAKNTAINQVRVTVLNANNTPVAGQEVIFDASNGANVETQTVLTDGNGVAIASIKSAQSGISTVMASFSGTTKTVDVTFKCTDLAGACIDILDAGNGKLFTSSPSKAYLDSISGSGEIGTYTEKGTDGPIGGFYVFNWTRANALCTTYNTRSVGGRTNWRLATREELQTDLFTKYGAMYSAHGWPTTREYRTFTADSSSNSFVSLKDGVVYSDTRDFNEYASCVSVP